MARKKLAKADDMATLTVLIAFNGLYPGDVVRAPYDRLAQAWERLGLIRSEVDEYGPGETGHGVAAQDNPAGVETGTGVRLTAGGEPSGGAGTSGYGSAESLDQG